MTETSARHSLPQDIVRIVENMNEADLHALFALVRERLKFVHSVRDLHSLQQFQMFEDVLFEHRGEHIRGIVFRINRRTITVKTLDRGEWKVSPALLKRRDTPPTSSERTRMSASYGTHDTVTFKPAVPPSAPFAAVSRNAPCPCGSGKKWKKCHGA